MIHKADTPKEYLETIDNDWRREKILAIRKLIKKNVPKVKEVINYSMLGYDYKGDKIFHMNAQKAYVGFYVCDVSQVDPKGTLLDGVNHGKGCIRFKKTTEINEKNISQLIKNAVKLSDKGVKSDC